MNANTMKGGASAPSDRFDRADWLGLFVFALPIIGATLHSIIGG